MSKGAITNLQEVASALGLNEEELQNALKVAEVYPFSITQYYLEIASKSPAVRKTVVPSPKEVDPLIQGEAEEDPLNEEGDQKVPRLTHRYSDRVLIVTTNYCPVLCRFCMRKRNWRKPTFFLTEEDVDRILDYISENKEIRDVLVSGGEPFSLPVRVLKKLLYGLKKMENVEVVRIGTRLPVVDPQSLTDETLKVLEEAEKVWVNTHFNHPDEVSREAARCVKKLLRAGVPVNNQTVLLKGVNDSAEVLERLFRKLQQIKVRPYYLFHCDPVKGVMHFSTPISRGIEILDALLDRISPLAVPYYAVDGPGGAGR